MSDAFRMVITLTGILLGVMLLLIAGGCCASPRWRDCSMYDTGWKRISPPRHGPIPTVERPV